eukprot:gnl/TRDRNA2_/TRDRNA2_55002_c0_seq1.p1 gnl/TRDRNA2_/TRDRNA2_55002_c0~~gnl/TRDRNA2_/TRDRNA2_55002_c0_seq1.p1  ORF type:complete len:178 (+),score=25.90 gnl/TRDRNA2_/TRDRNA2_55002_c0_seq1:71-535(+)
MPAIDPLVILLDTEKCLPLLVIFYIFYLIIRVMFGGCGPFLRQAWRDVHWLCGHPLPPPPEQLLPPGGAGDDDAAVVMMPSDDSLVDVSNMATDELCVVCLSHKKDTLLLCGGAAPPHRGHGCVCQRCGQDLVRRRQPCPVCRGQIRDVIRIYG